MTTFLIPLLVVCVGTIVALAIRDQWRKAQPLSVTHSPPPYLTTIRDKGGVWRLSVWWMDWDAVEWWQHGVLWDDYDPLP